MGRTADLRRKIIGDKKDSEFVLQLSYLAPFFSFICLILPIILNMDSEVNKGSLIRPIKIKVKQIRNQSFGEEFCRIH